MVSFVSLYRGESVGSAELVAVSVDAAVVALVAAALLGEPELAGAGDPALGAVQAGRRRALELVRDEAQALSRPPHRDRPTDGHKGRP